MARHMVVFNVCSPYSLAVLTELKAQVDRDVEPVLNLLSPKSVFIKVTKADSGEGIPSKSIRRGSQTLSLTRPLGLAPPWMLSPLSGIKAGDLGDVSTAGHAAPAARVIL